MSRMNGLMSRCRTAALNDYGRISRSSCTWDEEFQVFTLTSDVEETSTRSEDISLDYDFFHSDLLEISCGGNYTAKVIPRTSTSGYPGCSLETRTAFPSSTTRTWIPWSTGQTRRRTPGLVACGDVYVVFGSGGYAAVGMAAEANRITYGNWRLPCGRPLFSYTKPFQETEVST